MEKEVRNIISFLENQADKQLRFLINLGNQNSYTHNKKGVDQVAQLILTELDGILPFHRVYEQKEIGNHHLLKSKESSKSIYLVGHLDTVFPPNHPFQQCNIKGELLYGPGVGDMKGGVGVMVYALKALKEVGMLPKLNLSLILNSDEEIGSSNSYLIFLEERKKAIACLVAECAGPNGEIVISRNGKLGARIDCSGKDRHVSNGTHEKSSAILELAHQIISIESLNAYVPGVSINIGKIEGGLGPSTVAAQAHCLLDVRWEQEEHKEILLNKIQGELSRPSQPGCHSEFKILNSRPIMPLNEANKTLFIMMQQTAQRIGQEINSEHRRGTSDANFFGSAGVPTLDGLGPISRNDHTADEFIKISSLKERSALLALFILEYSRKTGMTI